MNRRRHNRQPRTVQDFVRIGVLRPVQPSLSTGTASYVTGRLFTTDNVVRYTVPAIASSGGLTAAFRCVPTFAGNDNTLHRLFYAYDAASSRFYLTKDANNKWSWTIRDAVPTSVNILSTAQDFAANTTHHIVVRGQAGAATDLNHDGTDLSAGNAAAVASVDLIMVDPAAYTAPPVSAYIGPMIVSPSVKSDAWVAAIQADSGAAYQSIPRLVRDFMEDGDYIFPFVSDSTGFKKVMGTSPF